MELIDMSADAGVDAVKFQSFRGLDIVSPLVGVNEYPGWQVTEHTYWYQFLDSIALPLEQHQQVIDYSHSRGVDFITTPVSPAIVKILENMNGIDAYKLASMDLNNIALIRSIASTAKPVIMSTGMGAWNEVENAISMFQGKDLSVLHCVSDYPLDPNNAALNNISVLKNTFSEINVGFSDHSLGYELSLSAIAMGASIIEKHVTLDRKDTNLAEHHFSLEYKELCELVKWARVLDNNFSKTGWSRSPGEKENRTMYRRSFHYIRNISKGEILTEKDLVFVRPGEGIGYGELEIVLGCSLLEDVKAYSPCLLQNYGNSK